MPPVTGIDEIETTKGATDEEATAMDQERREEGDEAEAQGEEEDEQEEGHDEEEGDEAVQLPLEKWSEHKLAEAGIELANSRDDPEVVNRERGKNVVSAHYRANRVLGLEDEPFHNLFRAANTLRDLEEQVAYYGRQEA